MLRKVHISADPKFGAKALAKKFGVTLRTIYRILHNKSSSADNSPLLTEFDDFLVEYATIRLSAGNEYDMTQESQLMANIAAQIQQILIPPPVGIITKGYWK